MVDLVYCLGYRRVCAGDLIKRAKQRRGGGGAVAISVRGIPRGEPWEMRTGQVCVIRSHSSCLLCLTKKLRERLGRDSEVNG